MVCQKIGAEFLGIADTFGKVYIRAGQNYIVFLFTMNTIKPIVNFRYLLNVFISFRFKQISS